MDTKHKTRIIKAMVEDDPSLVLQVLFDHTRTPSTEAPRYTPRS